MGRIVLPQQTAFIRGRHIHECISLVLEGINMLDRKSFGRNIGMKIDITKAFDTLN